MLTNNVVSLNNRALVVYFSYLNNNNIAQLLKAHFQDCQFTGEVRFQYNDIGWIEDGTFAHFPTIGSL